MLVLASIASFRLAFWCARRDSNAELFASEAERWPLSAPFVLPNIVCLQQLGESALAQESTQVGRIDSILTQFWHSRLGVKIVFHMGSNIKSMPKKSPGDA